MPKKRKAKKRKPLTAMQLARKNDLSRMRRLAHGKVVAGDDVDVDTIFARVPSGAWEDKRGYEFHFGLENIYYDKRRPPFEQKPVVVKGWVIKAGCRTWATFEEARKHFSPEWRAGYSDLYFDSWNNNSPTTPTQQLTREICRKDCLRILARMHKAAKQIGLTLAMEQRRNKKYLNKKIWHRG